MPSFLIEHIWLRLDSGNLKWKLIQSDKKHQVDIINDNGYDEVEQISWAMRYMQPLTKIGASTSPVMSDVSDIPLGSCDKTWCTSKASNVEGESNVDGIDKETNGVDKK